MSGDEHDCYIVEGWRELRTGNFIQGRFVHELVTVNSFSFADVLFHTVQNKIATKGRGIMAMDESNATCGLRLASIGLENTEANRQAYRQLLVSAPGLGDYISGAILFEETLYQNTTDGKSMVDVLKGSGIIPGIKVDKVPEFIPRTL